MLLILFSTLVYIVLSTSNYIIDTPPGQLDDTVNGVVNWAYPIDICIPNHFVSRGITANVIYECKQDGNTNKYSVIRHSYYKLDTNCNGNVIKTKTFYTGITKGLPGYFVCDKEQSEYAIINVYDSDETCTKSPIPLYSVITSSDDPLCFHDRNVYISLFECGESGDDTNNLENSYIKEAVYEDNECINPIVSSTLTSSDCQIIGTMSLDENKGGRSIIFGRHNSCHDQYHNHKINMDDESYEDALFDGNDPMQVDVTVSSGVVYVGLIAFLFINGCLWWCYLYIKKDYR